MKRLFLRDLVDFVALATKSLEEDDFTKCFEPISPFEMEESRFFYLFSLIIRYTLLLPIRFTILISSTFLFIAMNLLFSFLKLKTGALFYFYSKALLLSFGAKIRHHGNKKRLKMPHLYVSNHTSFVDYIVLSSYKFPHACISENHGGLFGFLLNMLKKNNGSIGFKRSEKQDREAVLVKMKKHVYDINSVPMIIFPEGTCVNNKYTVLFQKGAFNLDCAIVPVAIKYRRNLMDPYWNRRRYGFTEQLFYLLTRWRLEADVWWMEERWRGDVYMKCVQQRCESESSLNECICARISELNTGDQNETDQVNDDLTGYEPESGNVRNQRIIVPDYDSNHLTPALCKYLATFETPSEFAMRVKELISDKGGLRSVLWNGYFKSSPVIRDREILREAYRNIFRDRNQLKIVRKEKVVGEHRFRKNPLTSSDDNQLKSNQDRQSKNNINGCKLDVTSVEGPLLPQKNIVAIPKEFSGQRKNSYLRRRFDKEKCQKEIPSKSQSTNADCTYFNCFTYKEYIEHVLNEYLRIKRTRGFNKRVYGVWWESMGCVESKKCNCDAKEDTRCNDQKCVLRDFGPEKN